MEAVRKLPRLIMLYCIPHARYEINRTEVICRQGFLERKGQTHLPPGPSLPTSLTFQSLTCWARVAVREAKWINSPPDFLSFQALLHYWWVKSPKGAKKIKNSLIYWRWKQPFFPKRVTMKKEYVTLICHIGSVLKLCHYKYPTNSMVLFF